MIFPAFSPVREGGGAHEALASGAKAAAGRRHDVALVQDLGKHIPGGLAGKADPHVGRVVATINTEAQVQERLQQNRIRQVEPCVR